MTSGAVGFSAVGPRGGGVGVSGEEPALQGQGLGDQFAQSHVQAGDEDEGDSDGDCDHYDIAFVEGSVVVSLMLGPAPISVSLGSRKPFFSVVISTSFTGLK